MVNQHQKDAFTACVHNAHQQSGFKSCTTHHLQLPSTTSINYRLHQPLMSQRSLTPPNIENSTPPQSIRSERHPLTPPSSDEKTFPQAHRVLALLESIRAGQPSSQAAEIEFQLGAGEYIYLQNWLQRNTALGEFVEDKVRYFYDEESRTIVIHMPTDPLHDRFIGLVSTAIDRQLESVRSGSGKKAEFARRVDPATTTRFKLPGTKGDVYPDGSFQHGTDEYPSIVMELANSQTRKDLTRKSQRYVLLSSSSIRVAIGFKLSYREDSRKATLFVYRPEIINTPDGRKLRAVGEVEDEAFRDDHGNPADHPGLQLHLSDFASPNVVAKELNGEDADISLSGQQLCQLLNKAEAFLNKESREKVILDADVEIDLPPSSSPEQLDSGDEAKFTEEEDQAEVLDDEDPNYRHKASPAQWPSGKNIQLRSRQV